MNSHYPILGKPLWFGTPWHGLVFTDSGTPKLRPIGTSGGLDRDWSGSRYNPAALWDIGKPDVETPEEIAVQGGQFLGRSLQSCALGAWRPVLLNGVVCCYRVQEDFAAGFILTLRAYNPDTGELLPAVTASTGRFSMESIGQGASAPQILNWSPPEIIRSYTGIDVTADGRSMLLAITTGISVPFSTIAGLIRLDIGGTPDEPTLTLSLVASRANALGTLNWANTEWSAVNQSWSRADPVVTTGPCGTATITTDAALQPTSTTETPGISASKLVTRTGVSVVEEGFTGRILTAWFSGNDVELLRYSAQRTNSYTVTFIDESSGTTVRTFLYNENCIGQGSTITGELTTRFKVRSVRSTTGTITVGTSSASFEWSETRESVWNAFTSDVAERSLVVTGALDGITGSSSTTAAGFTDWMPDAPPTAPAAIHDFSSGVQVQSEPQGGYRLHPAVAAWKVAGLARTRWTALDAAVDVKLWPSSTPAGPHGDTINYQFPATTSGLTDAQYRDVAVSNCAFNPLTGGAHRGGPGIIQGCI